MTQLRPRGDHFGDREGSAVASGKPAERTIRDAGHWSNENSVGQRVRADFHCGRLLTCERGANFIAHFFSGKRSCAENHAACKKASRPRKNIEGGERRTSCGAQ